ncbi:MAG TPA: hypothetical protein VE085_05705 [Burkholderiales bacterium]|nr:hypothetical protein [Burkholderiales bacterium]
MKRRFLAAMLASLSLSTQAASGDEWFGRLLPWYQRPCGLQAFAAYGHDNSPEVFRAYEVTKRDPSQCSALFP